MQAAKLAENYILDPIWIPTTVSSFNNNNNNNNHHNNNP